MDHVAPPHVLQPGEDLPGKPARRVQADADLVAKLAQHLAQVHLHALKHHAEVAAVLKRLLEPHNVLLVGRVALVELAQDGNFRVAPLAQGVVVAHDLDGDRLVGLEVRGPGDVRKHALAERRLDLVALVHDLADAYLVVAVLVVALEDAALQAGQLAPLFPLGRVRFLVKVLGEHVEAVFARRLVWACGVGAVGDGLGLAVDDGLAVSELLSAPVFFHVHRRVVVGSRGPVVLTHHRLAVRVCEPLVADDAVSWLGRRLFAGSQRARGAAIWTVIICSGDGAATLDILVMLGD